MRISDWSSDVCSSDLPWLEASAGTAGYFAPSADGSRPGILYVNTRDMRNLPIYELSALSYHEGVPGHHLEKVVTSALTGLPKFRAFGGFPASCEGWEIGRASGWVRMCRDGWRP